MDPWQVISMVSSPVYEWGAWKVVTITWSISWFLFFISPKLAVFGGVFCRCLPVGVVNMLSVSLMLPFPDRRMTAIPPLPGGVEIAHMMDSFVMVFFCLGQR